MLLWRSVIHFSLLLRQIRCMGVTHTLCSPFHGHLDVWSLGSSNAVALTICVQFLCGHLLAFLLGTKPKRINGLFDNCMFNFKWNCQAFPKWICHLHCHQECLSSRSSTFVPILGMVSFHWRYSVGSVVLAHLYLHFPSDSDIEHLSMHFDIVYLLWRSVCLNLLPIIYCVFAILIVSVIVL